MKFKNILLASFFASTLVVSFAVLPNKEAVKAEAIGNYSTDANTYYNGITATSGKQLAAQLHDLITSTHRYYTSYDDNGKNLYQQNTDQYYENGAKVNGYIYEFYSGAKWSNAWVPTATGGYNREHCWCQSNSFIDSETQMWGETGGGSDMHHLRPVEKDLNSTRNNHPYGEIDGRSGYEAYPKKSDGTYSTSVGGYFKKGVDIFEPIDSKKGDVARIILYVYLHYNSYKISSLFGSYGTTNGSGASSYFASTLLPLTNIVSASSESDALEMMLKWNTNDPVDDIERRRNEQVAYYQGNRNPFIDNSAYAEAIWGNSTGISYISNSSLTITNGSTATINATSSNGGTISWSSDDSTVCSVSSSTASSGSNITLTAKKVGTATITASITISGTQYSKSCEVTVENPKNLSSITITGQKTSFVKDDPFSFGGTVTAHYDDSSVRDVTSLSTFTGYDLSTSGNQTVTVGYTEGGTIKTTTYSISIAEATSEGSATAAGGSITGWTGSGTGSAYADGSVKLDSSGDKIYKYDIFSGIVSSNMTKLTVTINAKMNGSPSETNSYKIEAISGDSANYTVKNSITKTGTSIITTSYSNIVFEITSALAGTTGICFTYVTKGTGNVGLKSISWVAEYSSVTPEPTLTSISLDTSEVQTSFIVGDTFNYDHLVVIAHYDDDSTDELDSFSVSSPDMNTSGNKTITVTYREKTATYTINVNAQAPTSIIASVSKTFYVGETITALDISVEDNLGNSVENFTFSNNNYRFTYSDASSGGSLTSKTFTNSVTSTSLSLTCSLTVQVRRKAHEDAGVVNDTLDRAYTGQSGNSYVSWTDKAAPSSTAVYAGNNAGGNSSIQLRSNTSSGSSVHSGIVSTTSGGKLKSVTVTWHSETLDGRVLNIYGKNTAYTDQEDLYTSSKGTLIGTITKGTSTSLTIQDDYLYIGLRSNSGAMYLTDITISYGQDDSPENVANYIMYEDTNNQCTSKFDTAKGYFEGLTTAQRNTFMSSDDYVIFTARERLLAWAKHEGKTISQVNGDYSISQATNIVNKLINTNINNTTIIVIIISVISIASIGGYFLFRKKKEE